MGLFDRRKDGTKETIVERNLSRYYMSAALPVARDGALMRSMRRNLKLDRQTNNPFSLLRNLLKNGKHKTPS